MRADLTAHVANLAARLTRAQTRLMDERRARVTAAARALPRPDDVLALARQRFDAAAGRLQLGLRAGTQNARARLERLTGRLSTRPLRNQIAQHRDLLARHRTAAKRAIRTQLTRRADRLAATAKLFESLSYKSVLQRGYALVFDAEGQPVKLAAHTSAGQNISIRFQDGEAAATITDNGKPAAKPKPRARKASPPGNQGTLF